MKKFLLLASLLNATLIGLGQTTPCASSLEVFNNGNGGIASGSFQGYGAQGLNNNYKKSGEVKLRFSNALSSLENAPEIQNVKGPSPAIASIDFKFYPIGISLDKKTVEYAFYATPNGANGNLKNGKGSIYTLTIKYANAPAQICNVIEAAEQITLPVLFSSFQSERKSSTSVLLKWTTSSEQNNKGFYVQRNSGNGWKDAAFVFSKADNGNSSVDLSYEFKDVNAEKGITQYRLLQIDIDGKGKYSEMRAVRGEETTSKVVVYPNPSSDGKINLVFEDNSIRDVLISDIQGKTIKQYRAITGNVLVVDNLTTGFYTMKIVNRKSATSVVEKVVVK